MKVCKLLGGVYNTAVCPKAKDNSRAKSMDSTTSDIPHEIFHSATNLNSLHKIENIS